MAEVIVIGAGAAGMMAAITAAENGHKVTVLEKNEKPGARVSRNAVLRHNHAKGVDIINRVAVGYHPPQAVYHQGRTRPWISSIPQELHFPLPFRREGLETQFHNTRVP